MPYDPRYVPAQIPPPDRHIRRDGDAYGEQFLTFLPQGQAWPRDPGSTLVNACLGLAHYYGFVDGRAADLLEIESDPRITVELLPDWEKAWGLPDPCFPPGTRTEETFGPNLLDDTWEQLQNVALAPSLDPVFTLTQAGFAVTEDATDGGHVIKQQFVALAKGKYRASVTWQAIGPTPRGIMLSVEWHEGGANIWINPDGTINTDETLAWGTGVAISKPTNNATPDGAWTSEFTIDVVLPNTVNLYGLYLVTTTGTVGDSEYPGLNDGTGIQFRSHSLRTLTTKEVPIPQTIAERQKMLVTYMTWPGYARVDGELIDWRESSQSRDYFTWLMKFIGFEVADNYVGEFAPFMAGISQCGETRPTKLDENGNVVIDTGKNFRWYIGSPEQRFAWYVNVGSRQYNWFRAGSGQCGVDPHLRIGAPQDIQCLLNRWKPAHTELVFNFNDSGTNDPMAGTP